jgi:all-trans-retinol dehydrogenase (NAD+)
MSNISGAQILITGGASGIGRLMAGEFLRRGARRVIIWDADEKALAKTLESLGDKTGDLVGECIDITRTNDVCAAADRICMTYGTPDILVNNAGIVTGKLFEHHTHAEIDRTMQVNTQAMMHVTRAFLPSILAHGRGHLVNIASAAGMASNPQMSVYVASKWAVIGWSECIRLELEAYGPHFHVTTVTPFYISTGMFDGVRSPIVPIVRPERAVMRILKDVERNRIYSRMPWIVYAMPFFRGILPQRWYDVLIGKWFGIHRSMSGFRGRMVNTRESSENQNAG